MQRANVVGDTLKRKIVVADITITHCDIQHLIKNGMQHVLEDKKLRELAANARLGAIGWKKASCLM